jgi:hypothetical protein
MVLARAREPVDSVVTDPVVPASTGELVHGGVAGFDQVVSGPGPRIVAAGPGQQAFRSGEGIEVILSRPADEQVVPRISTQPIRPCTAIEPVIRASAPVQPVPSDELVVAGSAPEHIGAARSDETIRALVPDQHIGAASAVHAPYRWRDEILLAGLAVVRLAVERHPHAVSPGVVAHGVGGAGPALETIAAVAARAFEELVPASAAHHPIVAGTAGEVVRTRTAADEDVIATPAVDVDGGQLRPDVESHVVVLVARVDIYVRRTGREAAARHPAVWLLEAALARLERDGVGHPNHIGERHDDLVALAGGGAHPDDVADVRSQTAPPLR